MQESTAWLFHAFDERLAMLPDELGYFIIYKYTTPATNMITQANTTLCLLFLNIAIAKIKHPIDIAAYILINFAAVLNDL